MAGHRLPTTCVHFLQGLFRLACVLILAEKKTRLTGSIQMKVSLSILIYSFPIPFYHVTRPFYSFQNSVQIMNTILQLIKGDVFILLVVVYSFIKFICKFLNRLINNLEINYKDYLGAESLASIWTIMIGCLIISCL